MFGISQRSKGKIEYDGTVTIEELVSYDLVASPSFSATTIDWYDTSEILNRIQQKIKLDELLKTRIEKIKKLNNL